MEANGTVGGVCEELFGEPEANVACRQLGFVYDTVKAVYFPGFAANPVLSPTPEPYLMDQVGTQTEAKVKATC